MAEEELGNLVSAHPQQEEKDEILSEYEKEKLSEFLAEFPIQPLYTKPNDEDGWWCFWSQTESSQANSSLDNPRSVPDPWTIHKKLKSVLTECHRGLIQFWVPVTRSGRRLLTTFNQPFAVAPLDTDIAKHKICCQNYLYDIDFIRMKAQEVEDSILTINGPPATAFLNRLPQLILDLRSYSSKKHLYPLLASALEHGLTCYIVLPIFERSTTDCVGVLEHCISNGGECVLTLFDQLVAAIKEAGLITFDPEICWRCESIDGLQRASDEIEDALATVCVSHKLCLAQAWIQYEDKNHASFSSSTELNCNDFDFMQNKRGLAYKLSNYYKQNLDWYWENFRIECYYRPLIMGEGLVGKAFQNHEPYLCQYISTVDKNEPSLSHTLGINGNSFAVCLRSTYTQNLDYVLEFFWDQNHDYDSDFLWDDGRNVIILLESIMFTLKRTLPSFKVVTGKEIGTELCVKEITYSSEANKCVVEEIVISQQANKISNRKHKTSPISLHREAIEKQFGNTMIEAAKNLNVCLSTLKRKCKDAGINEWRGPKVSEEKGKCPGESKRHEWR